MMKITTARNLQYTSHDKTTIHAQVQCVPKFGQQWVDFIMSPNDCMEYGRDAHRRALEGEFGSISSYIEPQYTPNEEAQVFAEKENLWVEQEMLFADRQIVLHEDADARASATIEQWRVYRRDLRNYVKDNVVSMVERPQRPTNNFLMSEDSL